jgi:hypothetical protein
MINLAAEALCDLAEVLTHVQTDGRRLLPCRRPDEGRLSRRSLGREPSAEYDGVAPEWQRVAGRRVWRE